MRQNLTTIKYIVGIDLGTSNTALAWRKVGDTTSHILAIDQLLEPGRIGQSQTLASQIYFPAVGEATPETLTVPWEIADASSVVTGAWARQRSIEAPERTITSAKSWLCNQRINRTEACLPWKSDTTENRLSPIAASSLYIQHVINCFEYSRRQAGEFIDWNEVHVVLTVPASFDEVARSLTKAAADLSKIKHLTLLEEPQAAFYAWIGHESLHWRQKVCAGDVVLVVDIGGGTTDFSMIAVTEIAGNLELERISVGDHLLLGGDNMDLALAVTLQGELQDQGKHLDHWQFQSLIAECQRGKETLFANSTLHEYPISLASRGASLFASAITAKLTRHHLDSIIIDGFFPVVDRCDFPKSAKSLGFREFGLDYENEVAITRHLAAFLRRSRENIESDPKLKAIISPELIDEKSGQLFPTKILYNGGVFNAEALKTRMEGLIREWSPAQKISTLSGGDPDLAVAIGAADFAATKVTGSGIRIRSGIARSYYLGMESVGLAIPGARPKVRGLCIVPQGTEEGSDLRLDQQQFGLATGEEVEFRFFSSSVRAGDKLGQVVSDAVKDLTESARLSVKFASLEGEKREVVPVTINACVTDVGTLELHLNHRHTTKKWNLEFNVRSQE
jgi:hypothetical protein